MDAEVLERDHPEFVQNLIRFHDAHQGSGYWRTLVGQLRTMLDAEPDYTEADLRRVPERSLVRASALLRVRFADRNTCFGRRATRSARSDARLQRES
jgi:hypothetical protein